jgi:hypothetical protein
MTLDGYAFFDNAIDIIINGDYQLQDWKLVEGFWDRKIISFYNKVTGIFYINTYPKNKPPYFYHISFYNINLKKYYYDMYGGKDNVFNTVKEAQDRTDEFLIKLKKLKAFL